MDWSQIKYFSPTENFGDPNKMDQALMLTLDRFREKIGEKCKILCGYATSGHAENSFHYLGRAIDCRFTTELGLPLSLMDHFIIAMKAPFNGVGIYTHSVFGPFLHLDNRESKEKTIWVCEKEGDYRPLTASFIRKLREGTP